MIAAVRDDVEVVEMTVDEARHAFHLQTCDALGMTREQFLTALDHGDFDDSEDEQVLRLRMLAPFGR